MKKYVKSSSISTYLVVCKKNASKLADDIMDWQDSLVGDPILSDSLSEEDITTLDKARAILYRYSEEA